MHFVACSQSSCLWSLLSWIASLWIGPGGLWMNMTSKTKYLEIHHASQISQRIRSWYGDDPAWETRHKHFFPSDHWIWVWSIDIYIIIMCIYIYIYICTCVCVCVSMACIYNYMVCVHNLVDSVCRITPGCSACFYVVICCLKAAGTRNQSTKCK